MHTYANHRCDFSNGSYPHEKQRCYYSVICETEFISPLGEFLIVAIGGSLVGMFSVLQLVYYLLLTNANGPFSVLWAYSGVATVISFIAWVIGIASVDRAWNNLEASRTEAFSAIGMSYNMSLSSVRVRHDNVGQNNTAPSTSELQTLVRNHASTAPGETDNSATPTHMNVQFLPVENDIGQTESSGKTEGSLFIDTKIVDVQRRVLEMEGMYHALLTRNAFVYGLLATAVLSTVFTLVYYIATQSVESAWVVVELAAAFLLCVFFFWRAAHGRLRHAIKMC